MTLTTLFWAVCIPARALLASVAIYAETKRKRLLQLVLAGVVLVMAMGFVYNHLQDKTIGFFQGVAWWAPVRLLHASLLLAYAVLTTLNLRGASGFLVLDVLVAALTWFTLR